MAWQWAPGAILTATDLNATTIPWNAKCQVTMVAPLSVSHNTVTTLLFDSEDYDARGWHSTVSNTNRITPTIQGWYRSTVTVAWQGDTDFTRQQVELRKNGSSTAPARLWNLDADGTTTGLAMATAFTLVSLNGSSDYLDLAGFQTNTSGGANTANASFLVELVIPF